MESLQQSLQSAIQLIQDVIIVGAVLGAVVTLAILAISEFKHSNEVR